MNLADAQTTTFCNKRIISNLSKNEKYMLNSIMDFLSNNWKLKMALEPRQHERAVEVRTGKRDWT